ncbi:MAG: flap endonuclease [Planctomycetota bacterium]|nr:flap endonuclease [Planctomycetota bacterium]
MQLHLIDATYELFRAFHALPPIKAPDGGDVAAVYGLLSSLLSLLKDPAVTHLGCATDHTVESFRNQLFAGYKTGEGVPEVLMRQFPLAEEGLRALGLVVWPMIEFEADDALAAAARRWGDAFERVLVCSVDKDLAQCVRGDHVVLWDRRREKVYDEAAVVAKWGVPPRAIPDLLALIGDAADGLPGVPGWGAKSAAALLSVYGAIEAIPPDPAAWTVAGVKVRGAERLAASLRERRDDALLWKRLATLRVDVPLAEDLDGLRWQGAPRAEFAAFCRRMGFRKMVDRPTRWRDGP